MLVEGFFPRKTCFQIPFCIIVMIPLVINRVLINSCYAGDIAVIHSIVIILALRFTASVPSDLNLFKKTFTKQAAFRNCLDRALGI